MSKQPSTSPVKIAKETADASKERNGRGFSTGLRVGFSIKLLYGDARRA
jgi:hypothetical protein